MSAWQDVYDKANRIKLIRMVQQISHNQVEQKSTYLYVELFLETFMGHQEPKETNNDYYKIFKSQIETVKAHGGKPWILDSLRDRILGKVIAENRWIDISALSDNQAKDLKARTDKQAKNKFIAGLFVCMQITGSMAS